LTKGRPTLNSKRRAAEVISLTTPLSSPSSSQPLRSLPITDTNNITENLEQSSHKQKSSHHTSNNNNRFYDIYDSTTNPSTEDENISSNFEDKNDLNDAEEEEQNSESYVEEDSDVSVTHSRRKSNISSPRFTSLRRRHHHHPTSDVDEVTEPSETLNDSTVITHNHTQHRSSKRKNPFPLKYKASQKVNQKKNKIFFSQTYCILCVCLCVCVCVCV
jgi:hypothetical protein